ncbi:MAG: flagellar hook-length control protein FliK [Chromatiales bacterium]|nr:flagellar hook-length control protein FliK [Chromatiales bacterium]
MDVIAAQSQIIRAGTPPAAEGLRPGATLNATAVIGTPTGETGGRAVLLLNGQNVEVTSPVPLQAGDSLKLLVTQTQPQLLLNLLLDRAAGQQQANLQNVATTHPATAFVKDLLPRQGGLNQLLSLISHATTQPGVKDALPPAVGEALGRILDAMMQAGNQNAAALRRALSDSGLFLEARLGKAATSTQPATVPLATSLQQDMKALLLGLLDRLPPNDPTAARNAANLLRGLIADQPGAATPPPPAPGAQPVPQPRVAIEPTLLNIEQLVQTLRHETESALARITLHQLSSLDQGASEAQRWLLELPLRNQDGVDLLHMKLEGERQRRGKNGERIWSAMLAVDLPGLGPLTARIGLIGERITAYFWAEAPHTVDLIETHLERLRSALSTHGLEVTELSCRIGKPPPEPEPPTPSPDRLLDVRA